MAYGDLNALPSLAERVIRCRDTGRYWRPDGSWADGIAQAATFHDAVEAARTCVDHDLHNVELVLCQRESKAEFIAVPMR